MNANHQLLTTFNQSFQNKDYIAMQNCYADGAVFNDPVFVNLTATEVKAMWQMFCVKGKDVQIQFGNVQANDKTGSAEWIGHYTFSKTGRKVVNRIKANFVFENGKIIKHTDEFNFYTWARQALGVTGLLLGWTGFVKDKVRGEARKNLQGFMNTSFQRNS